MSQLSDIDDIQIIDCGTDDASFFRNAGHILHGTGESYQAMCAIHGHEDAKKIMSISERFCNDLKDTVYALDINCDYVPGKYLVIGKDEHESGEISESIAMLKRDGFKQNTPMTKRYGEIQGFKGLGGARACSLSASAHPVKFRNAVLEAAKNSGVKHVSCRVKDIEEMGDKIRLEHANGDSYHDFVVVCTNAYTNLLYGFIRERGLIEPFKGQIIVSKPMKQQVAPMAFSSDHGYMYGTITADNRILIGGWRNNVPGMESNTFDHTPNALVEDGLKGWVKNHMNLEDVEWEYSWGGIMGSSSNKGLPIIGQADSPLIWTCAGFTGYGFGWAHGAAKMLSLMMIGEDAPDGYELFNPRR
jgi:gamma-glutamylputrescine oxidase